MTIPSMILLEEIKNQGFSPYVKRNVFGELYIGYGHKLHTENLLADSSAYTDKKIRKAMEKKLLASTSFISQEEAENLLTQDIITHYETLSKASSAFRHLKNACKCATIFPKSQLGVHYSHLERLRPAFSASQKRNKEMNSGREEVGIKKIKQKAESVAEVFRSYTSSSSGYIFPLSTSSSTIKGKVLHTENTDLVAHIDNPLPLNISHSEAALIRLDVLIYLLHHLGLERFLNMKKVFENICVNNYLDAGSYMLSYPWSAKLKDKAVRCALRMKYGRIVRDPIKDSQVNFEEDQKLQRSEEENARQKAEQEREARIIKKWEMNKANDLFWENEW